jgi:hypothetical protein
MTLEEQVKEWKEIKHTLRNIRVYQGISREYERKANELIEKYHRMRIFYEERHGSFKFDKEPE